MSEAVCKGCWGLSNNCTVCSRCKETDAAWLSRQLHDERERLREVFDDRERLRQLLGIVTVRSTSGRTETVCQMHLLPRHHQMLLDECERLRARLHQQEQAYEKALRDYRG